MAIVSEDCNRKLIPGCRHSYRECMFVSIELRTFFFLEMDNLRVLAISKKCSRLTKYIE